MKGGNASNFGGGPNPPYNPFMNQSQPQIPPPSNYSTTGVPQVPPGRVSFDDIDNAVKNQNGTSPFRGMDPTAPAPSYTTSNHPPRPPSISSDTLYSERLNEKAGISNGLSALAAGQASSSTSGMSRIMQYAQSQYTGPPILPAINSGEMFEWGDIVGTSERRNVDAIVNAGLASSAIVPPPETYYGQQPLAMPQPPQLVGSTAGPYGSAQNNASSNSLAAPSSYPQSRPNSASAHAVSRPPSATYSSYNATQSQHAQVPSDPVSVYTRARSSQSHLGIGYAASSHYTSSNEQVFDHFGQDVEAYASGRDSGARKNVRSRSATPMGNEEYMAVGAGEDEGEDDELDDDNEDEDTMEESTTDYYNDNEKKGYGYSYGYGSESRVHFVNPIPEQPYKYPDTPVTTQHYGPAPAGRVMRRIHQKKRVQLTNGNLVIDLNVPTKLVLPLRREEEMLKTRYTAVTCDPDDFKKNNFFLRQNEYGRSTELFIAVTMYNEDEVLFCRTLNGVMRNIGHLCTRRNSQTWGQDAWKKVVVCIISDGRKKIHPRVLDCLTALGVYQNGNFMKNMVNNKPVTAHVFEYTASFGLDENLHFRYPDKGIVPTQILFCLKEKNLKKINSHRWFFNAFAPLLKPNVCVLIDVGTRPGPKSLYYLWKTFDLNSNVAGACGEIAAYKGRRWKSLLNPLVASQNFEYKISNILDKPTESLFGYISVLPGAFSAYRYIALQNNKHGFGPLASYFKGEVLHGRDTDIFTSNMYLAEDRILCFELVAKEKSDWVLRYVKNAVGETDVPEALPEFISQRRRWLNGSFFASIYAVAHAAQIIRSGHSTGRKVMLMIETVYNIINLVFAWFSLGNFYLFFNIVTSSLEDPAFGLGGISYFNSIIQYAYVSIVIACFLFSMGNRPKASPWKYKLSSIFFAIINIYTIVAACLCASQAATQGGAVYSAMLFSVIITYGAYAISSLLALDPWHMLTSFVPYILLSPTYINILNIYAFSNLDDISWGTKQDNDVDTDLGAVIQNSQSQVDVEILTEPSDVNQMYEETLANLRTRKPVEKPTPRTSESEREQQTKDYYANVRTNVLLVWVLSNGLLLLAILSTGDPSKTFSSGSNVTKIYMTFILAFVGITSIIRFAGSTLYMLAYILMG